MMIRISALTLTFIGITLAATCPPLTLPNGTVTYEQSNRTVPYSDGTVAYGMCNLGFALFGTSSTMCENGKWKWEFGECKEHRLPAEDPKRCFTMVLPNGNITFSGNHPPYEFEVPEGTTAHLTCTYGFEVVGGSANFTCIKGSWEPSIGSCELKNCTLPVVTPKSCSAMAPRTDATLSYSNGSSPGPFPQGTLVTMKCHAGNPVGAAAASCYEGSWFPPMLGSCSPTAANATGKCGVEVSCNGMITYSDNQILKFMKDTGTTGTLTCYSGRVPDGPTSTYCQGGEWVPPLGNCVGRCP